MLTEKKTFTIDKFTTISRKTINGVKVGYESYGTLNAQKNNVILVCHYFSGSSHAAGKYRESDALPGYWDSLIGPGKFVDTDNFFVISSDTLSNMYVKDPNVITTGPSSINPDTGKRYGLTFPVITIKDFVALQKLLIDSLEIPILHAVMGPSMGSMQAVEWASSYPDMVERVVAVIPAGLQCDPYCIAMVETWAASIVFDPFGTIVTIMIKAISH
jgi:homoserine O-acetyltransferase